MADRHAQKLKERKRAILAARNGTSAPAPTPAPVVEEVVEVVEEVVQEDQPKKKKKLFS